jgi:hypothetical protein
MQAVTDDEMVAFLSNLPELRCQGKQISFYGSATKKIVVDLRVEEPHHLVRLARMSAALLSDESKFDGGLLWITQWGVWNRDDEEVASNTLERCREFLGEPRSLKAAPGHFFRSDEFLDAVSCLVPPMLVGWDAFFIPRFVGSGLDYFLFVSHDSYLVVETRTEEAYRATCEKLASHKWIKIRD